MGQHVRTSVIASLGVLALSLLLLFCFSVLPVAYSQTKPGPPSAPPITVSVIEVSPKTLPLYTEYTGTTDTLDTVEVRARVDGFIEQKLFRGGQVIKAGERLYLLDQRTFNAEVQKANAALTQTKLTQRTQIALATAELKAKCVVMALTAHRWSTTRGQRRLLLSLREARAGN